MADAIHPGPCLRCSLPWRTFGPHGLLECDNEHVFVRNTDGTLTEKVYPEFTDQQIRNVEVEMYREGVLYSIPNRRAALARLRYEHDQDRTDAEYASRYTSDSDEALHADRHAEITEAERSEEVHGG